MQVMALVLQACAPAASGARHTTSAGRWLGGSHASDRARLLLEASAQHGHTAFCSSSCRRGDPRPCAHCVPQCWKGAQRPCKLWCRTGCPNATSAARAAEVPSHSFVQTHRWAPATASATPSGRRSRSGLPRQVAALVTCIWMPSAPPAT
jgi:hypothetical protein